MTLSLTPKAKAPPRDQVMKAALRFLQLQDVPPDAGLPAGDTLPALQACTDHLRHQLGVASDLANEIAMLAWAEIAGRQVRCYVDLKSSSPHLLFLVDPVAGKRHAIPVCDLVRMLGPRAVG